jgi:hypothetical protein
LAKSTWSNRKSSTALFRLVVAIIRPLKNGMITWATAALFVPEHQVAFPAWIIERQEEIERALERNEEPPSRLSNRLDLIDRT